MRAAPFIALCAVCAFVGFSTSVYAQRSVRDSALFSPHIHIHGGAGAALGDLGDRFGSGGNFGAGFHLKYPSGWFTGFNATFGFGYGVEEEGVLSNLLTPNGQLIDNEGQVALLTITGRSGLFTADAGHLFNLPGKNPNTGILFMAGVGSVHHRVHFENTENPITQLAQPYLSGYDRLAWGVAVKEFLGYWHMSDDGLINWFGGLELWQARTWPQRPMNFDTQEVEVGPRNDRFVSLQVGWVFHIYKRSSSIEHWY